MIKRIRAHDLHPHAIRCLRIGSPVLALALGSLVLALPALAAPAPHRVSDSLAPGFCARAPSTSASSRPAANRSPTEHAATANAVSGDAYLVKDINLSGDSYAYEMTPVGDIAFFAAIGPGGNELWKTDGTEVGTVRVKNIRTGTKSSSPSYLTAVGKSLFFTAVDNNKDRELWVSDGTSAGTRRVKNISPSSSSSPYDLVNVNGTLFFGAYGPGGAELWKSDGTELGTVRVKDLLPGPDGSRPSDFIAAGGLAFFSAQNKSFEYRLWRSDGTAGGTYPLSGQDPYAGADHLMAVGDRAYFTAANDTGGCSLETSYFRSDGTNQGTFAVADELMEDAPKASFKNRFYYGEGSSLKKANRSETSGVLVKAFGIPVSTDGCNIVGITQVGSRLFVMVDICAYDAGEYVQTDRQLWKSDGTKTGTKMVLSWGRAVMGDPLMTDVGGVLFFSSMDIDGCSDVWRSDGTATGTMPVTDIGCSYPYDLTEFNSSLLFNHDDGVHGRELWSVAP